MSNCIVLSRNSSNKIQWDWAGIEDHQVGKQLNTQSVKDPLSDHHGDLKIRVLSKTGCTIRFQIFNSNKLLTKTKELQKEMVLMFEKFIYSINKSIFRTMLPPKSMKHTGLYIFLF